MNKVIKAIVLIGIIGVTVIMAGCLGGEPIEIARIEIVNVDDTPEITIPTPRTKYEIGNACRCKFQSIW